jgi:hypothetical protein
LHQINYHEVKALRLDQFIRPWIILKSIFILTTLACSALPFRSASPEANIPPTRTPLPTFTPTVFAEVPLSIPPTPTLPPPPVSPIDTPVPAAPPTEPPAEVAPTDTPVPPPTEPPAPVAAEPPPAAAPPPAEPPPPAAPAEPSAQNGVLAKISFRDGKNTYAVGEKVFVKIEANNVEGGIKSFGILGLTPDSGSFQTSWDNSQLEAGKPFNHEDGLAFDTPGNHKLWLSICFSTKEECQGPNGNWVRFEPGLDVIVQ